MQKAKSESVKLRRMGVFAPILLNSMRNDMVKLLTSIFFVFIFSLTLDSLFLHKVEISEDLILDDFYRQVDFFFYFSAFFLGPIIEEFVFRGPIILALNKGISNTKIFMLAFVLTLIFASLHIGSIFMFVLPYGVLLSLLAFKTRSLYLPIIFHSVSNMSSLFTPESWMFFISDFFYFNGLVPLDYLHTLNLVFLVSLTLIFIFLIQYFTPVLIQMTENKPSMNDFTR